MLAGIIMCSQGRRHESYSYANQTKRDMMNALHWLLSSSSHIGKTLKRILATRIKSQITSHVNGLLGDEQEGFWSKRNTSRSLYRLSCSKMPNVHVCRWLCLTLTSKWLSIACGWTAFSLNFKQYFWQKVSDNNVVLKNQSRFHRFEWIPFGEVPG